MNDIKIQEDEVEYVEWISKERINELIKNNEFREGNIEGYKYIINNMWKLCLDTNLDTQLN